MSKTDYKIFEKMLDLDLGGLQKYLTSKYSEMLNNALPEENELNALLVKKYNMYNNLPGQLNKKYNIFKFQNEYIKTLYDNLKLSAKEAAEYYGYDFDAMEYMIRGWFNYETKTTNLSHDPLKNERLFHDHLGGHPAPDFHGYYCVNAESSSTYYKMKDGSVYENKNINNRMIIVENGHPHSRGDWNEDSFRITIAYDIVPFQRLVEQGIDKKTHWIKFT